MADPMLALIGAAFLFVLGAGAMIALVALSSPMSADRSGYSRNGVASGMYS